MRLADMNACDHIYSLLLCNSTYTKLQPQDNFGYRPPHRKSVDCKCPSGQEIRDPLTPHHYHHRVVRLRGEIGWKKKRQPKVNFNGLSAPFIVQRQACPTYYPLIFFAYLGLLHTMHFLNTFQITSHVSISLSVLQNGLH